MRATRPAICTEAFVVRTTNFGESNRIVAFLSPDLGLLEGVATGARRLRSRFGSSLELLSWVELHFRHRPGRDLVSISKVKLLESSFALLSRPESLELFSHFADLAGAVANPGTENAKLVRLIHAMRDRFNKARELRSDTAPLGSPDVSSLARLYFDIWVARLEGFWPSLSHCSRCESELTGARRVGLSSEGARCFRCAKASRETYLTLSASGAALVERVCRESPEKFIDGETDPKVVEEAARIAEALLSSHLERTLPTMKRSPPRVPA